MILSSEEDTVVSQYIIETKDDTGTYLQVTGAIVLSNVVKYISSNKFIYIHTNISHHVIVYRIIMLT